MNPLHSSISSSESVADSVEAEPRTLQAFPRPTPATWAAVLTVLAIGVALATIGGWSHGSPPSSVISSAPEQAFRYNATNRPRGADIVLLGDSLLELGVIADQLALELGRKPGEVTNLAISGAQAWDVEWIAGRIDPPKTDGLRLAVIQVDRTWFDTTSAPGTNYSRARIGDDPLAEPPASSLDRARVWFNRLFPQRRESRAWNTMFLYNWLGYRLPGLVKVPKPQPPRVWDLDAKGQRRAVEAIDARSRRSLQGSEFAVHSASAIRLAIAHLKSHSYRVVLLMTPLRHDSLASIDNSPDSSGRDRRLRELITSKPPYFGAEAFIEIRDSSALGAEDDDIFLDYGHLNRSGAKLLTRKLAEEIVRLGFHDSRSPGGFEPPPGAGSVRP